MHSVDQASVGDDVQVSQNSLLRHKKVVKNVVKLSFDTSILCNQSIE